MKPGSKRRVVPVAEKLPEPRRWVNVITPLFRCMGYLDDDGKWRDVNRHEVIENVTGWSSADEAEG